MKIACALPFLVAGASCAIPDPRETAVALSGGTASLSLANPTATIAQTSAQQWSLAKTGAVDAAARTVTWTITATKTTTTANRLVVAGCVTMTNDGWSGATLGNILVNLQTRVANTWVTQTTDIANATAGDAATTAAIAPHASSEGRSSFATNAASGNLEFTSPCGGAAFSLAPEDTIAGGATLALGFTATFDNTVLALPAGTPVRAELVVSSGNAPASGPSAANVDINGNGAIDPDEAWVRSVPARLGFTVPSPTIVTSTPTIVDTAANITTTGTVAFSNAQFSLGAATGTVTATVDGGTAGGTITNCAQLVGMGLANVQACDTETIAATTSCTPGAVGCAWQAGQVVSFDQSGWAGPGSGVLVAEYVAVYAASFGTVTVGLPAGFTLSFDASSKILGYLPASGPSAALNQNYFDPSITSSGSFGGDVLALRLDVDFSDAGALVGTAGLRFGDLTACNLTATPDLDGMSVRNILAIANVALGGGATTDSIAALDQLVANIGGAFTSGTPSPFAVASIFNGACPP